MDTVRACSRENVEARVREFLTTNFTFGGDGCEILDTDSFIRKGILDSTGILELIEFIESTFGVEVGDQEAIPENLDSLSNVADFVVRKTELERTASATL